MSTPRPIRSSVLAWLHVTPATDEIVSAIELGVLADYEARWDTLAAMVPNDPGAEPLLKTMAGALNHWQAAAFPILFVAVYQERLALKAEADRVLGAGQLLIAINESPL